MDKKKLNLMQNVHTEQLKRVSGDVSRLKGFANDYERLIDTLTALPEKTHHDALIPLGGAALMPGSLVHTNEVLVYLGDNYLVERTAKQARGIATRRLEDVKAQLKSFEHSAKLQSNWVDKTEELEQEGGLYIEEHVTEEEYQQQQIRHREMVLRDRQLSKSQKTSTEDQRDVMKLLDMYDEMEREEHSDGNTSELSDLVDNLSEESTDSDDESKEEDEDEEDEDFPADLNKFKNVKIDSPIPLSAKKFTYQSEECSVRNRAQSFSQSTSSSGEAGFSGEVSKCGNVNKVPVTRRVSWADQSPYADDSPPSTLRAKYTASLSEPATSESTSDVTPAVLVKMIQQQEQEMVSKAQEESPPAVRKKVSDSSCPKSILKKLSSTDVPSEDSNNVQPAVSPSVKQSKALAFAAPVVARDTLPTISDSSKAEADVPPKKISKFKASRQKM